MVKVMINGAEYEYRFDLGAQMRYEQLTGKLSDEQKTATVASICMHYACLAADESFTMSLSAFVSHVDSKATLEVLNDAFAREQNRWQGINAADEENEEDETPSRARGKKK